MFETVSPAPPDAILGLTESFKKDPNPKKINLGVGVYKDENGTTPTLACVCEAARRVLAEGGTKVYMPISGAPEYGRFVQELLFGPEALADVADRIRTAHTPGGTGALRVGADLLKQLSPDARLWLSAPTWANHPAIFGAAGYDVQSYPYYDVATRALDEEAFLGALESVPAGDIVLLHVCCHNPTGVDPTPEQWGKIAAIAAERGWLPFLDFAYQGFADSLDADRHAVLQFLESGVEFLVASSFSKNFGLYQDRVGALTLVAGDEKQADAVFSHLKRTVRVNYSNPPAHGGHLVCKVLSDAALKEQWEGELNQMRARIQSMRTAFVQGLQSRGLEKDFSFIERQNGMFSFSGLTDEQVGILREEKSIYIVKGGRINVAGITPKNIDYLCDAVAEVIK